MAEATFRVFGIKPVPLSVIDVMTALQTNMVDAVYASPLAAVAMQWFTKTKYLTDVPLIFLVGALVVKKNVFQKISPEHQKLLRESHAHTFLLRHDQSFCRAPDL